jgi:hypothetical protein
MILLLIAHPEDANDPQPAEFPLNRGALPLPQHRRPESRLRAVTLCCRSRATTAYCVRRCSRKVSLQSKTSQYIRQYRLSFCIIKCILVTRGLPLVAVWILCHLATDVWTVSMKKNSKVNTDSKWLTPFKVIVYNYYCVLQIVTYVHWGTESDNFSE